MLEGVVQDWVAPVAAMLQAHGASPETARAVARLYVAVGRGLLLDVLATGEDHEVDAAMRYFSGMLLAHLAASRWLAGLRIFRLSRISQTGKVPPASPGASSNVRSTARAVWLKRSPIGRGNGAGTSVTMSPSINI